MIDKDTILQYPTLDQKDRDALERAARSEGRHVRLLDEMIILARQLDEARRTHVGEDELAYLVAQEATEKDVSDEERSPFARSVYDAVEGDENLSEDLDALRRKAASFLATHDAEALFESLRQAPVEANAAESLESLPSKRAERKPVRRARPRRLAVAKWSSAVAVLLVAIVGALALASMPSQSEIARLGHFEADEINLDQFLVTARSADSFQLSRTDSLLVEALDRLRAARNVKLGLFPIYDQELLAEATSLLSEVVVALPGDDFVSLEARFLRARSLLLQEDPHRAMQDLKEVLQYEGTRNARARSLLSEIRAATE